MSRDPTLARILGDDYEERLKAYGRSRPDLLDDAFIFDAVVINPSKETKNWTAWYKMSEMPLSHRSGVPLKVIFPELDK